MTGKIVALCGIDLDNIIPSFGNLGAEFYPLVLQKHSPTTCYGFGKPIKQFKGLIDVLQSDDKIFSYSADRTEHPISQQVRRGSYRIEQGNRNN